MSMKNIKKEEKIEDDVEEVLVYVDIEPTSLSESQIHEAVRLKMVGNEKKVLMQVNNRFFEGEFDFSVGTHVFFEKDETATPDPLYSQCNSSYKYVTKTNKLLKMNRVILKDQQRLADEEEKNDEEVEKESGDLTLTRTYLQALNLFLPPGKEPPREMGPDEDITVGLVPPPETSTNKPVESESSMQILNENSNQLDYLCSESPIKDS